MNERERPPVRVHMIGNAHIDPVWLWPMSEGRAEVVATYRTALQLLREFEGYVFSSGGSVTYQWVCEDDPALFEGIQQAVHQGRWALVNGWWLQPDCNVPNGESFARHVLYGQRYLEAAFGRRATVGYNVDTFGHAATLPQLLRLGGLDYYVFFRPGPHEKDLPKEPFWWEAPGGTRVLACRPPLHYGNPEEEDMRQRVAQAVATGPQYMPIILCFYGVGDHGGGPTRRNLSTLTDMMASGGAVTPVFSSPDRYFAEVEGLNRQWPVVHDDLQHHARGCYTALSRVKRENRQAEHLLMQSERFSALAHVVSGGPNRQSELQKAWRGVLFNQFHDILAGTSIRSAYQDVWDYFDQARRAAAGIRAQALDVLEADIQVEDEGQAVILWNPLAWDRTEAARIKVPMGGFRYDRHGLAYPATPVVMDDKGNSLPAQIVEIELDYSTYMVHVDVSATVPALGSRVLYVTIPVTEAPACAPQGTPTDTLENEVLSLHFDSTTGWLTSIRERCSGVEFLAGPANVPIVIDDPSDTWSHGVAAFREEVGRFRATSAPTLIRSGPVVKTVRVTSTWGNSRIEQDISLYGDEPVIDIVMRVDWHERLKMLKLGFPLALDDAQVTASAPYGYITREPDGEEHPCQAWLDVSGTSSRGQAGLSLVNDSKYGYDVLGSELRLSVLRSPIYAFHRPREIVPGVTYHYTDQGLQELHYRLYPHDGDWRKANADRAAYALHEPFLSRSATPREGKRTTMSLLRVDPANAILTAAKLAEGGEALIVRGYEAHGRATHMTLTSDRLTLEWSHDLSPHEIWTLRLPLTDQAPVAMNLLEEPLQT